MAIMIVQLSLSKRTRLSINVTRKSVYFFVGSRMKEAENIFFTHIWQSGCQCAGSQVTWFVIVYLSQSMVQLGIIGSQLFVRDLYLALLVIFSGYHLANMQLLLILFRCWHLSNTIFLQPLMSSKLCCHFQWHKTPHSCNRTNQKRR